MFELFSDDLPLWVNLVGIGFVLIAVVGWAFLGLEWGAGFSEQPITSVLGVCGFVVAIGVTLWRLRNRVAS